MNRRILCFGDSLTWGADPASDRRLEVRWPLALQSALGPEYTVIEEGQGGRNIATDDNPEGEKNGLKYILPCLESHSPLDLVIVMLGTNDCKRKFAYSVQDIAWEMERFLRKVLDHCRYNNQRQYEILLMSPPPICEGIAHSWLGDVFGFEEGMRKSRELSKWYLPLAERYGCHFLDAGKFARSSEIDGIHMDAENQQRLGEAVADFVRTLF